ncbi:hypothetical protein CVT25_000204 [Psilocybe cyanescens]|uniref:Uncharacterized protein n=1 Tax=Psilocybe cyanescens TaxID=93625 RepID=A0A409XQL5_PSICY|nr:hypothetical protein CVT25_000204 [Psilocybe cyanescens]
MGQCAASDEFLKELAHNLDGSVVLPKVRTLEIDTDMMMPSHWAAFGKILPTKSKVEDPPLETPLDTQKTFRPLSGFRGPG